MGVQRSRRLLGAIFCAAIFGLIVAGCGGGGSSDETSPSSSKAAYVKSADAICTKTGKEVKAQYAAYLKKNDIEEGASKESPAEMKAHVIGAMETVAIPAFNKQIEKLKALEAPSELKAKTEEFIAAVEAAVEKGEAEPLLIFAKEPELFVKSDKVAKELGFRVCGNH